MGKEYVWYNRKEKRWYARVPFIDEGKRRYKYRAADDRSHAKRLAKELFEELEDQPRAFVTNCKTFSDLCDYYKQRYLIAPEYAHDQKVAGLRSYKDARRKLEVLRAHFGKRRLREITHGDLLEFRTLRFRTPIVIKGNRPRSKKRQAEAEKNPPQPQERKRAAATVHRELELLRTMFAVAYREGFIRRNPFIQGDSLIQKAIEQKRERVLTRTEEARLLAACVEPRAQLRPVLICALDTGMRMNEIYALTWRDVDLHTRQMRAVSYKGKLRRERLVPISTRLAGELEILLRNNPKFDDRVFGDRDTYRRSFNTAKQLAKIDDFRLHDCRHTCGTRLAEGGMHVTEIARILGHTNVQTAYRYINTTETTTTRAIEILDRWQVEGVIESEAVN